MSIATVKAHAKINLILEVQGRRPDGYHELKTVMHTLALADTIEFRPASRLIVTCDHPGVPGGPDNLVYRAVERLAKKSGVAPRVHLHIRKRIPVAAGLGGGSSDAAAVISRLSRIWGFSNPGQVRQVARSLGSDVPFLLHGGCALGTGRGDRIFPWPAIPGLPVVVVNPGFPVSTAGVYKKVNLRLTRKKACINIMRQAILHKNIIKISQNLFNHLETVTQALHPVIVHMKQELIEQGMAGVLMSGSGPTVFGLTDSMRTAQRARNALVSKYPCVLVTQTA